VSLRGFSGTRRAISEGAQQKRWCNMDEPKVPASALRLTRRFSKLHQERKKRHVKNRGIRRGHLSAVQRAKILASTGGRCHICGGRIRVKWQADHVLSHSSLGQHSVENCLPAHHLCNNYRWDYSPEEFQWILKLGVWVRTQIERATPLGSVVRDNFHEYELRRHGRRARRSEKAVTKD
jgi:hypothetical protein